MKISKKDLWDKAIVVAAVVGAVGTATLAVVAVLTNL